MFLCFLFYDAGNRRLGTGKLKEIYSNTGTIWNFKCPFKMLLVYFT